MAIQSVDNSMANAVIASGQVSRPNPPAGNIPRGQNGNDTSPNPSAVDQARASKASPSKDELESAVQDVQKFVQASSSDIQFQIDDKSGSTVVQVIDRTSKEVIRQIPSKEMLEIARALDRLQGLLVKQQA